jgi:hypothetical protein
MGDPGQGPGNPRFLPILLYVLGFMGAVAILALAAAWLLRRFG